MAVEVVVEDENALSLGCVGERRRAEECALSLELGSTNPHLNITS